MPTTSQTEPVALFGDLAQGVWGLAVGADEPRWSLAGPDGVGVAISVPLSIEPVEPTTASDGAADVLELCQVRGAISVDGTEREVALPGVRCLALDGHRLGSVRMLGMWFPGGPALALAALRPTSASGQDRDRVLALAGGEEQPLAIDPRLSTTYDRVGVPRRVGVEVWLGDSEDAEHRSRRMAGEATGAALAVSEGSTPLEAYALRCHCQGQRGTGVYAMLRLAP